MIRYDLMKNSQAMLRMSLACSDILLGIFFVPLSGLCSYLYLIEQTIYLDKPIEITSISNNTFSIYPLGKLTMDPYNIKPVIADILGFTMHLSFLVTVFTLFVASIDRFWAISNPFKYDSEKAMRLTKYAIVTIWIVALAISILPFFLPALYYDGALNYPLISHIETPWSIAIILAYVIIFGLPVLATAVISIMTFRSYRVQARIRLDIVPNARERIIQKEKRLAKTLFLMVGAFAGCVLPSVIMVLFSATIPQINARSGFRNVDIIGYIVNGYVGNVAVMLSSCNSLFNVYIYNVRNVEFRDSSKKFISGIRQMTACSHRESSGNSA